MDDANIMLTELRQITQEYHSINGEIEALEKARDALKERKALLEQTWRIMQSRSDITMIQAKMIAHEDDSQRNRNRFFLWWESGRDEPQSWWVRFLRTLYLGLGGR